MTHRSSVSPSGEAAAFERPICRLNAEEEQTGDGQHNNSSIGTFVVERRDPGQMGIGICAPPPSSDPLSRCSYNQVEARCLAGYEVEEDCSGDGDEAWVQVVCAHEAAVSSVETTRTTGFS